MAVSGVRTLTASFYRKNTGIFQMAKNYYESITIQNGGIVTRCEEKAEFEYEYLWDVASQAMMEAA